MPMTIERDTARSELLHIQATTSEDTTRIRLAGEADISTVRHLKETLATVDTRGRRLDLGLSELQFCDATTAWELLELVRETRTNGGEVRVVEHPNQWVATMLRILDIGNDLPLSARPDPHVDSDGDA
jgi:anti-anti-sigma factor